MDISVYLHAFTGFFVIVDPIGAALVFHSLIPENEVRHRRVMAFKAAVLSTILLIVFGNYGEPLLDFLGININSLRIAGGFLLFYTAFEMITKEVDYTSATKVKDISVFPMTIPFLAGPGALTLSILMFSNSNEVDATMGVIIAIITVLFLTLVLMVTSGYLKKVIGRTGDEILRRFLGVLLAALAIQFVYDGIMNMSA